MKKNRAGKSNTSEILARLHDRIEEALFSLSPDGVVKGDGYGALDHALDVQIKRAKERLETD